MTETTLPPLFAEDLAQMRAHDVDAMLLHYHPDAQVMRLPDTVARGREEIRQFLGGYLALKPEIVEVRSAAQSDDCVLYHSTIRLGDTTRAIVGTWVLRDGLIWRQTAVIVPAG